MPKTQHHGAYAALTIDRNAEALTADLEPDFEALTAYARAALVAGHIDEAGAVKVRLLASELHRVLSEHDPDYGHGGALSETKFKPDANPIPFDNRMTKS